MNASDGLEGVGNALLAPDARHEKDSARSSALSRLSEIFQPRRFEDYALTPDGFRKK